MMFNGKHRQSVPGPLCASFAPLLPVLDDLTDTRLAHDTRAHLAECAWCRAQRATYDRFDAALRLHFAPDAVPILSDNVMRTLMSDSRDDVPIVALETASTEEDGDVEITVSPLPIPPQLPKTPKRSWRLVTGAAGMAAVLVISLLAGLIFVSHGRPLAPSTNKHATHTPGIVPGSQISLMAIGMSSPADGWAMGSKMAANANGGSSQDPAYVLHYTGGRWVEVQTEIHAWISAIKMLSPTDGWAVGTDVYHYDGVTWREVKLPVMTQFNAIDVVSPNDIWLAGDGKWTGSPDGNTTILHYDGSAWTQQATPRLGDFFSISSLSMVSAQEGWAVGSAQVSGDKGYYPPTGAILHYMNGTWHLAKTLPGIDMRTVSMASATDGWAGGNLVTLSKTGPMPSGQSPFETNTPRLWHYTGGQWIEASSLLPDQPPGSPLTGDVTSITMVSATQGWLFVAWEMGNSLDESRVSVTPSLFRLEQGRWVSVRTPTVQQRRIAAVWQVVFVSPDEFWGVGSSTWWTGIPLGTGSGYQPTVTPLIVHYKNGSWDVIES